MRWCSIHKTWYKTESGCPLWNKKSEHKRGCCAPVKKMARAATDPPTICRGCKSGTTTWTYLGIQVFEDQKTAWDLWECDWCGTSRSVEREYEEEMKSERVQ